MKVINYMQVPLSEADDLNRNKTTWRNGRLVMTDEGRSVTLYLGHRKETVSKAAGPGEPEERERMTAFPVRVEKPLTRAKAVNAAEMEAYGLVGAMDVASLNASLARKWRENVNDLDVAEHDAFIAWVKAELDSSGLFAESSARVDTGKPTLSDVMELSSIVAGGGVEMTDTQSARVKRFYPEFSGLVGKELEQGRKVRDGEDLYKVLQTHTASAEWRPSQTPSLFGLLSEHEGTQDDPIPYRRMMVLEVGKYYTQFERAYRCVTGSVVGYDADLSELLSLLEEVEG